MDFKYTLSKEQIDLVANEMSEFANGGTQVQIRTSDGKVYKEILISNCMWIVAIRGYKDLPFELDDIVEIFQTDDDIFNVTKGNWECWDECFKKK